MSLNCKSLILLVFLRFFSTLLLIDKKYMVLYHEFGRFLQAVGTASENESGKLLIPITKQSNKGDYVMQKKSTIVIRMTLVLGVMKISLQ